MRRGAAVAIVAGLALAASPIATGAAPKPPKPPKPKLELLTKRQQAALRRGAIVVRVESKRGESARVRATLIVEGYPDPYTLRLGPDEKRLRGDDADVRLRLSRRQRDVLAFGVQACWRARVEVAARAGKQTAKLSKRLRRPRRC